MSAPVTAEELAAIERLTSGPPRHWKPAELTAVKTMLPRLARDLAAAQASIRGLIESMNEAQADRNALAAKIETMLRDEEDARRLRLAEHAAREDVAGKLAELQAAVRAHEQLAGADKPVAFAAAEDAMWAAAKA